MSPVATVKRVPLLVQIDAEIEYRKRLRLRQSAPEFCADPIARLFDPSFTEPLWYYEFARNGDKMLPGKLHAKQIAMLHEPKKHRWPFWGNQSGKTTLGAVDVILSTLGRHPLQLSKALDEFGNRIEPDPPYTAWASALSWDLWGSIMLPELLTWIPRDRLLQGSPTDERSTSRTLLIMADNGTTSRITGKSAEQGADKYQSARVNKVWMDEEHPEAVYDEVQPRLLRFGGRMINTMTPLKGLTYVYSRVYEPVKRGEKIALYHATSHAGQRDNPAIKPEHIAEMTEELAHNPGQLASRLDGLFSRSAGAVYGKFDIEVHGITLDGMRDGEPLAEFLKTANCYGGLDFGKWRFAFAFGGVGPDGTIVMIDEMFSQNEEMPERAQKMHDLLVSYGAPDIQIYADCAVPDDLLELNQCLAAINSKYYVLPVEMKNKNRAHGVARVGSLLTRNALRIRRSMGHGKTWFRNMSSNSKGHKVTGSRFVWEMAQWAYPVMPDGKVQTDDPDDNTADGADMMDGFRYLVLQWLGPLALPEPEKAYKSIEERIAEEFREMRDTEQQQQHSNQPADMYGVVLRQ